MKRNYNAVDVSEEERKQASKGLSKQFRCDFCGKTFSDEEKGEVHIIVDHIKVGE